GSQRSLVEHWDGRTWSVVSIPNASDRSAHLNSISAVNAHDVWVVGYDAGSYFTNIVLHWDGSSWQRVAVHPLDYPPIDATGVHPLAQGIVALAKNDVWIGATASVQSPQHYELGPFPYFVHWD